MTQAQADQDRLVILVALVLIGVPLDNAIAMPPAEADALLAEWREPDQTKAN